ncbi:hypothetical protein ACOSP7_029107 [Xanthoceras sorbifolium]
MKEDFIEQKILPMKKITSFIKKIFRCSRHSGGGHSEIPYRQLDSAAKPIRARKGHVLIYVGEEAKRCEVPVKYLKLPLMKELIKKSMEGELDPSLDFLILACTPERFDFFLKLVKKKK